MRSTASKINQLLKKHAGYAAVMTNPIAPYILISATKIDTARLVAAFEKIELGALDLKKIHRVKIASEPAKRRAGK